MLTPPALVDLQSWMAELLRRPLRNRDRRGIPIYEGALLEETRKRIKPGPLLPPEKRIGLYNQQVWYRFFNLLQKDYPSLVRIFGEKDFNFQIAEPYLQAHFPIHPSLTLLGSSLPAYLAANYHQPDRKLVLPLAALDEATHRLKNSTPLPPLHPDSAHGIIGLQPTLALFELEADFFAFRTELLKHPVAAWSERDFPPLSWSAPHHLLLVHQNDSFHTETLPPAAFRLLSSFQQKASLSDALGTLSDQECQDAEPHLFSWFQRWCSLGWLV